MYPLKDKTINFTIRVEKARKKKIKLSKPCRTRLRHISLIICKMLHLDRFNTRIKYHKPGFNNKISEITTLRQLNLKNGDTIIAEINRTHAPPREETFKGYFKDVLFGIDQLDPSKILYLKKKIFNGINVVGYYVDDRGYKVLRVVNLGYGEFPFRFITYGIEVDQNQNSHIGVKKLKVVDVYLKDCSWSAEGYVKKKSGIWNIETLGKRFRKVNGIDKDIFRGVYNEFVWRDDAVFKVRKLVQKKGMNFSEKDSKFEIRGH